MAPSDPYNIALDCIDKNGRSLLNKHKIALVYVRDQNLKNNTPPLRLTFSQLMGLTDRMANVFKKLAVPAGDRVLLRLPNCPEFPIGFLGAVKAGAIPIPSFPLFRWPELKFLLEDSGAGTLITTPDHLPPELLRERPKTLKNILLISSPGQSLPSGTLRWQEELKQASAQFEAQAVEASDPAYWLYTSGTTGHPKAVIHAHRSIRAHDARVQLWLNAQAGDVIFNTSSLNWSYALTAGMLDIWRHGLTSLIFQGELNGENICGIVKRFGVTTFASVPGLYRRISAYLAEHPDFFFGVRVCLSSGENLQPEVREQFKKISGLEIFEGLGMTEHSIYLVQRYGEPVVPGSPGKPLPKQRIKILREDLSEVPTGETGILATHRDCEGLMLGYFNRPEEEKESFRGEWFLSGDFASRDEAGNFYYQGRRDDVITAGGFRISPLEVEKVINQCPQVEESAVVGKILEPGKSIVLAFVVLNQEFSESKETEAEILNFANTHLTKYKVPRQIIIRKTLPKTATGKIKRNKLAEAH